MTTSASSSGAKGGIVLVAGQVAKLFIQVAAVLVLSRMLGPEDFGLIAMVAVLMRLGDLLRDFGLATAGLQAATLTHQQASNLFWLSSGLGIAASAAAVACTPLLMRVYSEPRLAAIVPAMAVTLAFNGMQAQLQVQLARDMKFRSLAYSDVFSQAAGLAVAIFAAARGWGYWALVAQVLAATFALLLVRFCLVHRLPYRPRRGHGSMDMIRAGGNFGVATLLGFAANNADTISIGAVWGPTVLGFYNRAFQLLSLPLTSLLGPLSNVVIPIVNRARASGYSTYDLLLRIQFAIGLAGIWAFSVSAATAPALIPLALGDSWVPTVGIFRILAVGGVFQALSYINFWVFIVERQQRQLVLSNLATKPLAVVLIVTGAVFSVEAAAWAYSAGLILNWFINLIWLSKCAQQPSMAFLQNGMLILFAGAVGFLSGHAALSVVSDASGGIQTLVGGVAASVFFGIALVVTPYGRHRTLDALITLKRAVRVK